MSVFAFYYQHYKGLLYHYQMVEFELYWALSALLLSKGRISVENVLPAIPVSSDNLSFQKLRDSENV